MQQRMQREVMNAAAFRSATRRTHSCPPSVKKASPSPDSADSRTPPTVDEAVSRYDSPSLGPRSAPEQAKADEIKRPALKGATVKPTTLRQPRRRFSQNGASAHLCRRPSFRVEASCEAPNLDMSEDFVEGGIEIPVETSPATGHMAPQKQTRSATLRKARPI